MNTDNRINLKGHLLSYAVSGVHASLKQELKSIDDRFVINPRLVILCKDYLDIALKTTYLESNIYQYIAKE